MKTLRLNISILLWYIYFRYSCEPLQAETCSRSHSGREL